eukprot:scaffold5532_cov263-Pinguiococcus_pyrenoidosus.AAC.2
MGLGVPRLSTAVAPAIPCVAAAYPDIRWGCLPTPPSAVFSSKTASWPSSSTSSPRSFPVSWLCAAFALLDAVGGAFLASGAGSAGPSAASLGGAGMLGGGLDGSGRPDFHGFRPILGLSRRPAAAPRAARSQRVRRRVAAMLLNVAKEDFQEEQRDRRTRRG